MKNIIFIIVLSIIPIISFGQGHSAKGVVMNEVNEPVEAVTCILKSNTDTTWVKTVISESTGQFSFENIPQGNYSLSLHHMAYDTDKQNLDINSDIELEPITLFSQSKELGGVVIAGERPTVKAQNGKLIFDTPQLNKGKVVTNALEAIKNIPNITGMGDDIQLAGATEFTILLNGQATSLSLDQLKQVLKSMPASKVKNVEIMYSAPPQYNVRGAAINVILNDDGSEDMPEFQGETNLNYRQAFYDSYGARANLLYNKPSFSTDLTIGGNTGRGKGKSNMHAIHHLNNDVYDIRQTNITKSDYYDLSARLAMNYSFKNKDKLQFVYTGQYEDSKSKPTSRAVYTKNNNPFSDIESKNNTSGDSWLHNMKLEYNTHKKFKTGIDYTFYKEPSTQKYYEYENNLLLNDYKTETEQKVNKVVFFANHETSLGKGWGLTYGGNVSFSKNDNDYNFFNAPSAALADSTSLSKQKEFSGSVFTSFTKSFTSKLSGQASISANYYKATTDVTNQAKKTLWDDFQPFVNANLTYMFSPKNILQFSFSSDIKYPPYWALSPDMIQLNAYSLVKGNPELKFSKSYKSQFNYIFNQKYILVGYYEYVPDYFTQLPYQSSESLQNIFQMVNLDSRKMFGTALIIPFNVPKILDSKLTLTYQHTEDKDKDFYATPYKKSKNSFVTNLTNTINISSKPNIKMDISAFYINGHVQGIYNIHHMSSVNAGLKWTFLNDKAELMAQAEDIFKGGGARTSINYADQFSDMKIKVYAPVFKVSFTYKFGGYKKKNVEDIDTSRFGRN